MNITKTTKIVATSAMLAAFTSGLLILTSYSSSHAAAPSPNSTGQALEIAPPVLNLTADPGEIVEAQINLRDVSTQALVVTSQINDFTAGESEDGTPKILLEEGEASPYSIRPWVDPFPELTLEPRQVESLPLTIRVPADAAPGGYFGVVRFTATPPELQDTGVSLSASLGALVLLRVNGEVNEQLEVEEFFTSYDGSAKTSILEGKPVIFVTRLNNLGSVHEQPRGKITITDMFGKAVAAINVNLPPRNILPESIRKFESRLDESAIGNTMLFGRYTAELEVTYGADDKTVTDTLSFWVIPYKLIGIIVIALIVGFFGLRTMIRRYNERIISRARRRR